MITVLVSPLPATLITAIEPIVAHQRLTLRPVKILA
jgi:hypothetical protein